MTRYFHLLLLLCTFNPQQTLFPTGKMVGGTSVLNGRLSARGNAKTYDDWAAGGAEGWSYEDVFPYFLKMENNENPEFVASGKYRSWFCSRVPHKFHIE